MSQSTWPEITSRVASNDCYEPSAEKPLNETRRNFWLLITSSVNPKANKEGKVKRRGDLLF